MSGAERKVVRIDWATVPVEVADAIRHLAEAVHQHRPDWTGVQVSIDRVDERFLVPEEQVRIDALWDIEVEVP